MRFPSHALRIDNLPIIDFSPKSLLVKMLYIDVEREVSKSYTLDMYFYDIDEVRDVHRILIDSDVFYLTLVLESADFKTKGVKNSSIFMNR